MSEEPPRYTGHDFAELLTADLTRAEAVTLLLRSHGIDARAMEANGWTVGGPTSVATVLVPRLMLEEARDQLRQMDAACTVSAVNECPICGYTRKGIEGGNVCPECGFAFTEPADREPIVCPNLDAKREKLRPIALGVALIVLAITVLMSLTRHYARLWW